MVSGATAVPEGQAPMGRAIRAMGPARRGRQAMAAMVAMVAMVGGEVEEQEACRMGSCVRPVEAAS